MNYDEIVNKHTKKLIEAENKLLDKINLSIAKKYQKLEKELKKRYPAIKNNDSLLFSQKAAILQSELKNYIDIASGDFSKDFQKLYETTSKASVELSSSSPNLSTSHDRSAEYHSNLNKNILNDSIRRLNRWGDEFINKGNTIVEMGFQQGWSQEKVASVLRSQLGSLQSRVENIVRTSNNSVANKAIGDDGLWGWIATNPEEKRCPFCAERNGNVYSAKDSKPPIHGHCACFALPVKKSELKNQSFTEWVNKIRSEGLAELEKAGGKPNKGVAPFEKQNGLTKAPRPVWTPEKGYTKKSTTKTLKKLTLAELKIKAEELGLTTKEIAGFGSGDLRTKDVWIKAIRSI